MVHDATGPPKSVPAETRRDLEGQVAVVTGAGGCIGARTAEGLGCRGATVVCADMVDVSGVVEDIVAKGGQASALRVDLRDEEAATAAVRSVVEAHRRLDVLVNMAGTFYGIPRVPFWEIDGSTWDLIVESNLRTAFLASRAASEPMRAAGRGRIVNVSSNTAVFGMANFMHYVSAKAGIVGLTRAMARELGPFGIAVNAVAPGLVQTERNLADLAPGYWDQVVSGQCLRTPIQVEDVVSAVVFLSSPESRMITGQTLLVNGGASMGAF
jgi:3-oxoacyl-[acyl-carrier protein] reductase